MKKALATTRQIIAAYTLDFDDENMEWENISEIPHEAIEGGQKFIVQEGILEVTYDASLDGKITLNGTRIYTIDRGTIRESREEGKMRSKKNAYVS